MASTDVRDSPYVANWDLVPPSPRSAPIDLDNHSAFEQVFNVPDGIQAINPLTSPIHPHTPSYNGSYYNSPFSNHSELADIDFFQDYSSNTTSHSGLNPDYEPSEYDAPNQGNSLLIFPNEADFMSPHLSPNNSGPDGLRTRGSPFDHGSPASSAGIDDNHHGGRHSRASSVSSNHASPSAQAPNTHSPQAPFQPSPRLEVMQSFGNMTVHTPNWGTQPLPGHSPRIGKEPLQQKPQSPPRLTMPSAMTFTSEATAVPKINAPDADDGGPAFNLVPATPVAVRDANGRQHLPFQRTLDTLAQGVELVTSDSGMAEQQQGQHRNSPFSSPHAVATSLSGDFFFPEEQLRQRRNSDSWLDRSFADNSQGQLVLNDNTYVFPQQQPQVSQSVDDQHRQQLQTFSFGGNIAGGFFSTSGDSIRRSASDSLAAPRLVHGKSRSEEIRFVPPPGTGLQSHHAQSNSLSGSGGFLFPPTSHGDFLQRQQQQLSQFLHPNDLPVQTSTPGLQPSRGRRSMSPGHLRRASSGSRSERGAEAWNRQPNQFQPTQTGLRRMSPYPTPNASPGMHYSELDELGAGMGLAETNMGLGAGLGLGLSVGVSSLGVEGIPGIGEPPISAGYSEEVAIAGRNSYGVDAASSHGGGHESAATLAALANDSRLSQGLIAKQNVTTGRTAHASIRRRKQEANFVCSVPGCGSTFTRGFNLKGHMRSHYEQKPYKCHWPGCDKGFARQHDCKRHEQLHSNYRPFVCEGCNKNFARMDALNRHLRSEAGAECAKAVEGKRAGGAGVVSGMLEGDDAMDDDEKPIVEKASDYRFGLPTPRRRNTNASGFNNPAGLPVSSDDMWSVAL